MPAGSDGGPAAEALSAGASRAAGPCTLRTLPPLDQAPPGPPRVHPRPAAVRRLRRHHGAVRAACGGDLPGGLCRPQLWLPHRRGVQVGTTAPAPRRLSSPLAEHPRSTNKFLSFSFFFSRCDPLPGSFWRLRAEQLAGLHTTPHPLPPPTHPRWLQQGRWVGVPAEAAAHGADRAQHEQRAVLPPHLQDAQGEAGPCGGWWRACTGTPRGPACLAAAARALPWWRSPPARLRRVPWLGGAPRLPES